MYQQIIQNTRVTENISMSHFRKGTVILFDFKKLILLNVLFFNILVFLGFLPNYQNIEQDLCLQKMLPVH